MNPTTLAFRYFQPAWIPRRISPEVVRLFLISFLAFGWIGGAGAQTSNWIPLTGGTWSDPANWSNGIPNGATADAVIKSDYVADLTINLTANTSVNAIRFEDTGAGNDQRLIIGPTSPHILSFAGVNPILESGSATGGGYGVQINSVVNLGTVGVTKTGFGTARFNNAMTGSGTLAVSAGTLELAGDSSGFTGNIVINSGGTLQGRGFAGTGANVLGTTAGNTTINGTGRFMFRDTSNKVSSEAFVVNGISTVGSIMMYASTNVTINGPVTLNSDTSFSIADWTASGPGQKRDFFINSVISDGSATARSVYFLGEYASTSAQGANSRLSEMFVGAASNYGGNTFVTTNKANDGTGSFSGNLRLNLHNALPTTTTLVLGGSHAVTSGTLGTAAGNGRFALGGFNQELSGLRTNGSGTENRVIGNSATLSTLTLNIAGSTTNTYAGFLGWTGTNDDNLALVKSGDGTLVLSAANTYKGATQVLDGTLLINGDQSAATGAVTVASGATFGGSGTVGGPTTIIGLHSPGNSPGVQTFAADLTYNPGASVLWELTANTTSNAPVVYDQILVGGDLDFAGATTMALDFDPAGPPNSVVDWTAPFWSGAAQWLVYDVAGTTSNFQNLSLTVTDWTDSNGVALSSVHPIGKFSLSLQGNDIYLNYAAVPEPSTALLLLGGFATMMMGRRRRPLTS